MKKILWLLCLAIAENAGAQHINSFKEVLHAVAENYPSIKARQAGIRAAAYNTSAARKDYLPDVVAGQQYTFSTSNGLTMAMRARAYLLQAV